MKKLKHIALAALTLAASNLAFSQSYTPVENAVLCDGWYERASSSGPFFLEYPDYNPKEREHYSEIIPKGFNKYLLQATAFSKAYKKLNEPGKEEWENDTTFLPRDKNNRLAQKIVHYSNHGAGFIAEIKLHPSVDVEKLKSYIESRDKVKLKSYSQEQLKIFTSLNTNLAGFIEKGNENQATKTRSLIKKTYPGISLTSNNQDHFKSLKSSIAGHQVFKDDDSEYPFATFIAIEDRIGSKAGKYLVCGIGTYY